MLSKGISDIFTLLIQIFCCNFNPPYPTCICRKDWSHVVTRITTLLPVIVTSLFKFIQSMLYIMIFAVLLLKQFLPHSATTTDYILLFLLPDVLDCYGRPCRPMIFYWLVKKSKIALPKRIGIDPALNVVLNTEKGANCLA